MILGQTLRRVPWRRGLPLAVLVTVLAACSPSPDHANPSAAPSSARPSASTAGPTTASASATPTGITKVLTIVLENHGVAAVTAGMPELMKLATTYGRTSHYSATTHPSLPNYLDLAGGSTFGVKDDSAPAAHPVHGPSVFDLALTSGRTARTYAEAMPAACSLESHGRVIRNRLALLLGDASYALYLTHPFVVLVFVKLFVGSAFPMRLLAFAGALAAAGVVGVAVHKLIEKPIAAVVKKHRLKRGAASAPAPGS